MEQLAIIVVALVAIYIVMQLVKHLVRLAIYAGIIAFVVFFFFQVSAADVDAAKKTAEQHIQVSAQAVLENAAKRFVNAVYQAAQKQTLDRVFDKLETYQPQVQQQH